MHEPTIDYCWKPLQPFCFISSFVLPVVYTALQMKRSGFAIDSITMEFATKHLYNHSSHYENRRYAHSITRTKKEVYGKRDGLSLARVVSYCSSRICFPYFCMGLPLLSYRRVLRRLRLIDYFSFE